MDAERSAASDALNDLAVIGLTLESVREHPDLPEDLRTLVDAAFRRHLCLIERLRAIPALCRVGPMD